MHMDTETIVSMATPVGMGAIGIIRVSGMDAFLIAEKLFKGKKKSFKELPSHKVTLGWIQDPALQQVIDEVLLIKMKAPNTYTREDLVEIHCHGSPFIFQKIIENICRLGARAAMPGEFTQRAFLNGRIDLSQAEAVMDMIQARAEQSLRASIDQLEGKLSKEIKKARTPLIEILSHIEAWIDYPEYDIPEVSMDELQDKLFGIQQQLEALLKTYHKGRIVREGLYISILGLPNVGKSSLLNALLGKERAIVTEIPGTTRDFIEDTITLAGVPVRLVDTAGIRETEDRVEALGVERSKKTIQDADLVLFLVDASKELSTEDKALYKLVCEKKVIVLINKIDIADATQIQTKEIFFSENPCLKISAMHSQGLEDLEDQIEKLFLSGEIDVNQECLLTNQRHKSLIEYALSSLEMAIHAIQAYLPLEIITIDIKKTAEHLGLITGESLHEDMMDQIFKTFCIGK